jgi:hemoglobin
MSANMGHLRQLIFGNLGRSAASNHHMHEHGLMAVTKEVPMQSSNSALPRSDEAQSVSTSITRRIAVAGLALTAAPLAVLAGAENAYAQAQQTMPEKSQETMPEKGLYERLGGVFAIAAVVDHFSDAVVKNPIVGQKSKNPQLREWHTKNLGRMPGLKFMRTLWVCNVSGGPFQFTATKPGKTPLGLESGPPYLPRRI